MSGILMAAAAGKPASIMTVDSATYTEDFGGGPVNIYIAGYVGPDGAQTGFLAPEIGALTNGFHGDAQIVGLFWVNNSGFGANGTSYIEVRGNRSAGFINSIKLDGVSMGAIGAPGYYAGVDVTRFTIGSLGPNPFGTSGTKVVEVL